MCWRRPNVGPERGAGMLPAFPWGPVLLPVPRRKAATKRPRRPPVCSGWPRPFCPGRFALKEPERFALVTRRRIRLWLVGRCSAARDRQEYRSPPEAGGMPAPLVQNRAATARFCTFRPCNRRVKVSETIPASGAADWVAAPTSWMRFTPKNPAFLDLPCE
jgi:hypothetical protein